MLGAPTSIPGEPHEGRRVINAAHAYNKNGGSKGLANGKTLQKPLKSSNMFS